MNVRNPRWLLAGATTVVLGCGGDAAQSPPPPMVTVTTPERRDVQLYAEFSGNTRAIEFAEIRARIAGTLEEQRFTPSSFVKGGDVLFVIEPAPYRASYDEAEAAVAATQSELARAESDLDRIEQAIQSNAVSRQDLDRAQAARDQADAGVRSAQARLEQARINFSYTEVRAPFAGQVSRRLVDIGNLVGAGEPTLLTTIARVDPMYVYFAAPERLVLALLAAQRDTSIPEEAQADVGKIFVATAVDTAFPHQGEIDFIDNTVDPATGTIELRGIVDNSSNELFPGLFVRIRVVGGIRHNAILVRERAIGTDLGGKYVMVLGEDDVVEQKYVALGPRQDDGTYVVDSGLDGTEQYIVNGMLRARPGFPVTPQIEDEVAGGL